MSAELCVFCGGMGFKSDGKSRVICERRAYTGSCTIPVSKMHKLQYDIPEEKKEEVGAYAIKLKVRFPHMSDTRILRKSAEYFKIKLVESA